MAAPRAVPARGAMGRRGADPPGRRWGGDPPHRRRPAGDPRVQLEHRTIDGPFDAVFTGWIPDDPAEGADTAAELASFGVTWWQTSIGWPEETLEDFRERIRRGPPGR